MKAALIAALCLALAGSALAQGKQFASIAEAAKANDLTAFLDFLTKEDLVDAVDKAGAVTIFAPTDAAFKALQDSEDAGVQALLKDKAKVAEVLKYHVVPGAALSGQRIVGLIEKGGGKWQFATLVPKELVNMTLVDGAAAVNGVPVRGVDVVGGKAMIHTIGEVLVPKALVPKAAAAKPAADAADADAAAAAKPDAAAKPAADGEAAPKKKKADAESGAAGVAATMLLAVPAALAALL